MKHLWLEYSPLGYYVYWEGVDKGKHHGRVELKKEGLLSRLDDIINIKRKSVLHLRGIPEEIREDFKEKYSGTKVKTVYED